MKPPVLILFSFLDFGVWPPLASSRIHYLTVTDSLHIN